MNLEQRESYLVELRHVTVTRSTWLFRDFLTRWSSLLGPLGNAALNRDENGLKDLLLEVEEAMHGRSDHQLAAQLCSPWSLPKVR